MLPTASERDKNVSKLLTISKAFPGGKSENSFEREQA